MEATDFFTRDEIARAREYHRPLYVALAVDICLSTAVTAWLAFGWLGDRLFAITGDSWDTQTLLFTVLVLAVIEAVLLPLSFWRGFVRERRWGFSTQTFRGWASDRAKSFGVRVFALAFAFLALLGSMRIFPMWWPLVAALGAAFVALDLVLVGPVLVEPIFNRFEPVADGDLNRRLRALAERAGVPVRDILVADASRRTRKQNAYVSGLFGTRRVVLFDTFLQEASPEETEVVIAHELGHRRHRDVAKGTVFAMASFAAAVLVAWPLDPSPRRIPVLLFVWGLLELVFLPFTAAFSRRLERRADRFALELTHDPAAFEAAFRRLAKANLADLDPPRLVYAFLFTHPTPPERIAATIP